MNEIILTATVVTSLLCFTDRCIITGSEELIQTTLTLTNTDITISITVEP